MSETIVTIDIERLRGDLRSEDLGAYFGGALMETFDMDNATPEELVKIAQDRGVDLQEYIVG